MTRSRSRGLGARGGAGLALAAALLACAATAPAPDVRYSGFLRNYAELSPGGEGEALLVYRNPAADFSRYDRVLIDPVTVWRTVGSDLAALPAAEQERLANHLYWALREELAKDWALADRPGPGTLRIRAAITEARAANAVMDSVSTVGPMLRAYSGATRLATGTEAFVGKAGVEGEVLDSVSGVRLLAAIDEQAGQKRLRGSTQAWDDVLEAYRLWATRLRERLARLRAGAG